MKKKKVILIISIVLVLLVIFCLWIWNTLSIIDARNTHNDIIYQTFKNATYSFTGKSEHFEFETGKVYFGGSEQRIYIADFKQTERIPDLLSEKVIIKFDNKIMNVQENSNLLNDINTKIDNFDFYLGTVGCHSSSEDCEATVFDNVTKDTFKESIIVEIEYCTKNKICRTEQFDLNYS